jgi:hypothetical protein
VADAGRDGDGKRLLLLLFARDGLSRTVPGDGHGDKDGESPLSVLSEPSELLALTLSTLYELDRPELFWTTNRLSLRFLRTSSADAYSIESRCATSASISASLAKTPPVKGGEKK